MQQAHPHRGYGMTLSACLWLGLFPLLQGGTYYSITHDKLRIMQDLSAVTLLCLLFDRKSGVHGDLQGYKPILIQAE